MKLFIRRWNLFLFLIFLDFFGFDSLQLPDELVSENNDYTGQQNANMMNTNGILETNLITNSNLGQQHQQSQIKQQIQFKIINGSQQSSQQVNSCIQQQQQQQLTNSPNRGDILLNFYDLFKLKL